MKMNHTLFRWVFAFVVAGAMHTALCQSTVPADPKPATTVSTAEEKEAAAAIENLLKFYKAYLGSLNAQLNEADAEQTGKTKVTQPAEQSKSEPTPKTTNAGQLGALRASHLQTGNLQAGSLPLTLPDVAPTQRPAIEYEGTMFQKAIRDKALLDRYKFLRDQKSTQP